MVKSKNRSVTSVESIADSLHREPGGRPAPHGLRSTPRSRRRARNRSDSPVTEIYIVPPAKADSKAGPRFRSKDAPFEEFHLGTFSLVNGAGVSVSDTNYEHLSYPRIERMWDSTNRLVRPIIGYYRNLSPFSRRNTFYIRGKGQHMDGGPMHKIVGWIREEILGIDTYYGVDFRPYGFAERYIGGFVPASWPHGFSIVDFNNAGISGQIPITMGQATDYGAEAYNRIKPKIAEFDAMQGFGQNMVELPAQLRTTSKGLAEAYRSLVGSTLVSSLKGGLTSKAYRRSVRRQALRNLFMPKAIADQFLNEQFGWVPFISDMKDLYKAYSRQTDRFRSITRENNHWIHRRGTVRNSEHKEVFDVKDDFAGYVYPTLPSSFYRSTGTFVTSTLSVETSERVWASGAFKFYAPEFDSSNRSSEGTYGDVMRLVHYYGLRVSPTVVWELTPWTWLVDWFSNAQGVIDNVTASVFDRLLSKYAYVMRSSHREAVNDSILHLRNGDVQCSWRQVIDIKDRAVAHPYGFNLDGTLADLSARQLAILSAIGLSR